MDILPKLLFLTAGGLLYAAVYIIFARGIPFLWRKPPKHELKYYIQLVKFLLLLTTAPFAGGIVGIIDGGYKTPLALTMTLFLSIFTVGMNTLMKNYYGKESYRYLEEQYEMESPDKRRR